MKCPRCSANNDVLAKVCDACGHSPLEPGATEQPALALASRINENLAWLRAQAGSRALPPWASGFLLIPSLGLSWALPRAFNAFKASGKSVPKLQLELGADLREIDTAYAADHSLRNLATHTRQELDALDAKARAEGKSLLSGLAAFSGIAVIVIGVGLFLVARRHTAEKARIEAASGAEDTATAELLAGLYRGNVDDAAARFRALPESALPRLRSAHPDLVIAEEVARDDLDAAIAKTASVQNTEARAAIRATLAERALARMTTGPYDNRRARELAAFIEPETRRAAALDKVLGEQALRFISQNRYADARGYIGAISSAQLRTELETRITERTGR